MSGGVVSGKNPGILLLEGAEALSLYILELIDWMMIVTVNISRSMRYTVFMPRVVNRYQEYSRDLYRWAALRSSLVWPLRG